MVHIGNSWDEKLSGEFDKEYYLQLREFLKEEYSTRIVYPDMYDIFNALKYTPYEDVRAVILGQDPYHEPGQAHGLCFSVQKGVQTPPSLVNIFRELKDDLGIDPPAHGCLESWAKNGVLLLNTVLTVREHAAHSHKGKGWEKFTDRVISEVGKKDEPVVFMLWGKPAQTKKKLITNPAHLVLESVHPSPLSVYRGFYGCGHFVKCNEFLKENGIKEIDWQIENDQASLSNFL